MAAWIAAAASGIERRAQLDADDLGDEVRSG
jgi:hypothetical protein